MATTLTSYVDIKGKKTQVIRGTVGTDIAKVARFFERARVLVVNGDGTAANTVFVGFDNETTLSTTVGSFHIHGGVNGDNRTFYVAPGQTLNAVAAADRDVSFIIQVVESD